MVVDSRLVWSKIHRFRISWCFIYLIRFVVNNFQNLNVYKMTIKILQLWWVLVWTFKEFVQFSLNSAARLLKLRLLTKPSLKQIFRQYPLPIWFSESHLQYPDHKSDTLSEISNLHPTLVRCNIFLEEFYISTMHMYEHFNWFFSKFKN